MPDYPELVLVRHGKSALASRNRLTLPEFRNWIDEYNRTGISSGSHPEQSLIELVGAASLILCSDYPRALESASRLAPTATAQATPILREAGRPPSWNCPIRLPLRTWDAIGGLLWRAGLCRSEEPISETRDRATEAAAMLIESAKSRDRVVAVGHGIFNRLLSDELLRRGWSGPKRPQLKHWGYAVYRLAKP